MKHYRQTFSRLYTLYSIADDAACYYCGAPACTLDHVPSLTLVSSLGYQYLKSVGAPFIKVACCSQCNSILSNKPLITLDARIVFLIQRLERLVQKCPPEWSSEELEELGANLRAAIEAQQTKPKLLRLQLAMLRSRLLRK